MTENLTVQRQAYEIKHEFSIEAEGFKNAKRLYERLVFLDHIDALLDAYLELEKPKVPVQGYEAINGD